MKAVLLATLASVIAATSVVQDTALCSVGFYRAKGAYRPLARTAGRHHEILKNHTTDGRIWHDFPGERCKKCPAGKYSASTTATACTKCASGWYQLLEGQNTCNVNTCTAGKYMTMGSSGQGVCLNCAPGKYSEAGELGCKMCPSGMFNDKHAAIFSDCQNSLCPKGKFQAVNPARCVDCGMNQYSDAIGLTSCKRCDHGIVTRGAETCVAQAQLGTYKPCSHTWCRVEDKCTVASSGQRTCVKHEKFVVKHKGTAHGVSNWENGIRHKCKYSKELDVCKCICWNPGDPQNSYPLTPAPTSKAHGCTCAETFNPVRCSSNDRIYSNLCIAGCHSASGCTQFQNVTAVFPPHPYQDNTEWENNLAA